GCRGDDLAHRRRRPLAAARERVQAGAGGAAEERRGGEGAREERAPHARASAGGAGGTGEAAPAPGPLGAKRGCSCTGLGLLLGRRPGDPEGREGRAGAVSSDPRDASRRTCAFPESRVGTPCGRTPLTPPPARTAPPAPARPRRTSSPARSARGAGAARAAG